MENPFELIMNKLETIERLIKEEKIIYQEKPIETMDLKTVAKYLGMSHSAIYKYTSLREIPHIKVGKKLYFRKKEVDEWMGTKKVSTIKEIEDLAIDYMSKRYKKK